MNMTTRLCPYLTSFVVLILAVSFSSRISEEIRTGALLSILTKFAHVFSFGTWIGIQFWATFIAGATMYFNMPRHAFGELQSILFPKYFMSGVCCSAVALATFCVMHPAQQWVTNEKLQVAGLSVSLLSCMLNYMYLEPNTTVLMHLRYAFERERGYGNEIGPIPDEKLKHDEQYLKITHKFACIHGFSSMMNILSYAGCLVHLWCLSHNVTL
ncbi:transmembrane protein 205 [Nematostella vectensis]|uniref:transmembrane protein 205 n=1 Tax=Nematostella vectensis TaxID=45351 RepID=UPI00207745E6|nr:transmembrane protein 205 [Nematostella vectensis]